MIALAGRYPSLAGIGQFVREGGNVAFELGWPEVERDTVWARRLLAVWGLGPADHVLLTVRNAEGPWFGPVVRALRATGVIFSNAEPYAWDVRRSTAFLDYLPIKAVIGLSGECADTLLADERAADLLRKVPVIWARTDAMASLRAAGLHPADAAMLGPALGVECPERSGLHLDPEEWQITAGATGLTLSVVGDRTYRGQDLALNITGAIDETPCACGIPGPRIRGDG